MVLTVVILASGTVGAYAQSRGGVFHFFKNDEEGMKGIVAPSGIGKEEKFYRLEQYTRIEDIPEEYGENFCLPPILQDQYEIDYIKILDYGKFIFYETKSFDVKAEQYIVYVQKHYVDKITFVGQVNDTYSIENNKTIEGIEVKYYVSEDKDSPRNGAYFYINNDYITIYGNVSLEQIEKIVQDIIYNNL